MAAETVCDFPGCGGVGDIVSRLSPEGYLVATGKRPIHLERLTGDSTIVKTVMTN